MSSVNKWQHSWLYSRYVYAPLQVSTPSPHPSLRHICKGGETAACKSTICVGEQEKPCRGFHHACICKWLGGGGTYLQLCMQMNPSTDDFTTCSCKHKVGREEVPPFTLAGTQGEIPLLAPTCYMGCIQTHQSPNFSHLPKCILEEMYFGKQGKWGRHFQG